MTKIVCKFNYHEIDPTEVELGLYDGTRVEIGGGRFITEYTCMVHRTLQGTIERLEYEISQLEHEVTRLREEVDE